MSLQQARTSTIAGQPARPAQVAPTAGLEQVLRGLRGSLALVAILGLWEAAVRLLGVPDYLLPAPSAIIVAAAQIPLQLARQTWPTLLESVEGFLIGNTLGLGVAIIFSQAKTAERAIFPLLVALRSIPVIAITPLLMLLLGRGAPVLVTIVALICFFPIVVNATRGLKASEGEVLEMMSVLAASGWQTLVLVRLPYALPYIFASLRVSATAAVLGAVVAEWLAADQGLGFFIEDSRQQWKIANMWAGIAMTTLLAVSGFGLVSMVERKLTGDHRRV